jgi:hypothetical protein
LCAENEGEMRICVLGVKFSIDWFACTLSEPFIL